MGASKYNISSDDVIYSVNDDGSITKIAKINTDGKIVNIASGKTMQKRKYHIAFWVAIMILSIGLIVAICIGVEENNSNRYLRNRIDDKDSSIRNLESRNKILKEEKDEAKEAISMLKEKIGSAYPLIITDILIANTYQGGDIETDYGSIIYSSNTMYLKPKLKYYGINSGYKTLKVKWIKPNGLMSSGASSPSGFTQSDSHYISSGSDNSLSLSGWGNSDKGHWESGTYKIEIWYENVCLKAKTFTIY